MQVSKALVFLIAGVVIQFFTLPARSITLEWDLPNAAEAHLIAGYRIYYGPNSCRGVANCNYLRQYFVQAPATRWVVTNIDLSVNVTNYFTITAVGSDGTESPRAEEIYYSTKPPTNGGADPLANLTESVVVGPVQAAPVPVVDTEEVVRNGLPPPDRANPGGGLGVPASGPTLNLVPVGQPAIAVRVEFDAPANKSCELQYSDGQLAWRTLFLYSVGSVSERAGYYDPIVMTAVPVKVTRRFYRLIVH